MRPLHRLCALLESSTPQIARFTCQVASLPAQILKSGKRYPSISSADQLAAKYVVNYTGETTTLDLGCGGNIRNPFLATVTYGVDIRADLERNVLKADISAEALPFAENYFHYCTAFDVLEHIPRICWPEGRRHMAFIELMNEVHRVLRPDGLFLHSTPAYPSRQAFQDPTHVNIITEDTMPLYFCRPHAWANVLGYGFRGSFELLEQRWVNDAWIVSILRAIK